MINDLKYVKINSVNPLCLIFGKVNGYFEELRSKIRDLIRPITKQSDGHDEKYMKIKIDSDDDLPPKLNLIQMMIYLQITHNRNSYRDNSC